MLLLYIYTHIQNLYTQTSALTKRKRKTRVVVILIPCSFFFVSLYYRSERNFNSRKKKQENLSVNMCCGLDWIERNEIANNIGKKKKEKAAHL